jgi:transcriptional regulator with XRE-family HTH domain
MSYFGRNIKKIRVAKNISQSTFAELFKLTRASIGAYEEGRAEAKIDIVIEIAEYYQLTLDQFLKHELTLNDIYHIREKSNRLELPNHVHKDEIEIPLVKIEELDEFVHKYNNHTYLSGLQRIKLPGIIKNSLSLEFSSSIIAPLNSGLRDGDLLIAQQILHKKFDQIIKYQIFIVLTNVELFLSRIDTNLGKKMQFSEKVLDIDDESVKAIWSVYRVISNKMPISDQLEIRMQNIENQLKKLTENLNR